MKVIYLEMDAHVSKQKLRAKHLVMEWLVIKSNPIV